MNRQTTVSANRTATLWWVLLAAAGTIVLTMGPRQTMGLTLGPLNFDTVLALGAALVHLPSREARL